MADIFISYARSTAAQAEQVAEALRGLGYAVWRDDELPAHRAYAEVIEERLKAAKAVVVIWSAEAVKSQWVRSEADRARADEKLVQLSVDGAKPPMPFDQIQCADLGGWTGDIHASGWGKVVASIAELVGGGRSAQAPNTQRAGVSICVLPFANMSGDAEQEYFADGISEDIITDLSKVSALAVISRNSAFTFKGKHVDLPQVARQLNVTHVLEGSVRKAGNRVRITAELIDGATNGHVWAERYDRDLDDIFALQDEIAQAIVAALKLKLFPEEKQAIQQRGTTNVEAYDLYLRAQALSRQGGAESTQRAIALLGEAVELDPRFAMAWVALAEAHSYAMVYVPEAAEISRRLMDEALERAIACAPEAPTIHAARGWQILLRDRDWLGASGAFDKAAELAGPGRPLGFNPFFLACTGRMDEAIAGYQNLVRTDPLSPTPMLLFCLDCAGRAEESAAESRRWRSLPIDPSLLEYFALLRAMAHKNTQAIKQQFKRYLALKDHFMPIHGEVLARFDDAPAVLELLREATKDPHYRDATHMYGIASLAAFFGDDDLALQCLRIAFIDRRGITVNGVWHPLLARLRKTQGFKDLARDLGLADYWRAAGKWGDYARPLGEEDFEVFG